MQRLLPIVFLLFIAAVSCKKNSGDHLPSQKMEAVLLDITMAETYSTMARDNTHPGGMKNTDSLTMYYQEVFAHHHITQEQFKSSLNWYKAHAEELDSIYTRVSAKADKYVEDENKKLKPVNPINQAKP